MKHDIDKIHNEIINNKKSNNIMNNIKMSKNSDSSIPEEEEKEALSSSSSSLSSLEDQFFKTHKQVISIDFNNGKIADFQLFLKKTIADIGKPQMPSQSINNNNINNNNDNDKLSDTNALDQLIFNNSLSDQ